MDLHLDEQNHLDIIEDPGSWLPIYFPISYPGITVYEGDVIKAKITRKLSSNNLNPDFFIDGALTKADGSTFEFDFASYHHQVPKTKSKFFRKLFEDGKARRLTKLDTQYLREYLGSFLPQYMIPTAFIPLESIPLTPNGKVDRKALPDPDGNELLSSEYEAPQSETEDKLTKIWQEILELDHVGIKNDFFDLGGHSLLAIRLVSLINKTFDIDIKIGDVFEHPTIESLAGFLETPLQTTALPVLKVQERPLHIPLSYGQERLWFIDQLEGSVQYHSPGVIHLKGNLNRKALQHAFQTLIRAT
jgi:acyl carrier protein